MAPLVMFRIAEDRIGSFDLSIEPLVKGQYALAKHLYRTWNGGPAVAACSPLISYRPNDGKVATDAETARQHIRLGAVDEIIDAMTIREADGSARCMRYGEFQPAYKAKVPEFWNYMAHPREVLVDFHPDRKPVLWRILLAQAVLHRALVCSVSTRTLPPRLVDLVERSHFDWRAPDSGVDDAEVLVHPFQAVDEYLQRVDHRS
jgi:hypothetical protein